MAEDTPNKAGNVPTLAETNFPPEFIVTAESGGLLKSKMNDLFPPALASTRLRSIAVLVLRSEVRTLALSSDERGELTKGAQRPTVDNNRGRRNLTSCLIIQFENRSLEF